MSWNAPQNWSELLQSVERGWAFRSRPLGVNGDSIAVLSATGLSGLLAADDPMTGAIVRSAERLQGSYMAMGRPDCFAPGDVVYYVARDNRPLAYVTRDGMIVTNDAAMTRRRADAIKRLQPALEGYAQFCAARDLTDWL